MPYASGKFQLWLMWLNAVRTRVKVSVSKEFRHGLTTARAQQDGTGSASVQIACKIDFGSSEACSAPAAPLEMRKTRANLYVSMQCRHRFATEASG